MTNFSKQFCDEITTEVDFILDTITKPIDYDFRHSFSGPLFKKGIMNFNTLNFGQNLTGELCFRFLDVNH